MLPTMLPESAPLEDVCDRWISLLSRLPDRKILQDGTSGQRGFREQANSGSGTETETDGRLFVEERALPEFCGDEVAGADAE